MLRSQLEGHIGQDPVLRNTAKGLPWLSFSVAHNWNYQGEKHTEWIKCTVWGKEAEALARNKAIKGGQMVQVDGATTTQTWCTQEGEQRKEVCINADSVTPMLWNEKEGSYYLDELMAVGVKRSETRVKEPDPEIMAPEDFDI